MSNKNKNLPPALRHGAYSGLTILPGEDPAEFEALRDELIREHKPVGRSEEQLLKQIAHYSWRLQNLSTYRRAEQVRKLYWGIPLEPPQPKKLFAEHGMMPSLGLGYKLKDARDNLGDACELAEIGEVATIDYLLKELNIADKLQGMINHLFRQLYLLKGLKTLLPPDSNDGPDSASKAA